jgi:hypothetical protein
MRISKFNLTNKVLRVALQSESAVFAVRVIEISLIMLLHDHLAHIENAANH